MAHLLGGQRLLFFAPHRRLALLFPSLYKLEECWLPCTAGNTLNTGCKYSISNNPASKKKFKKAIPKVFMLAYLLERFRNRSLIHGSSMVWSWVWSVPKYLFKDPSTTSRIRGPYFQPGTQTLNLYILLLFQPLPVVLEPIVTNTRCFQTPEIVQFGIMKRK